MSLPSVGEAFLDGVVSGFFENPYLRDFTHASKTFRSNQYAYAPKYKFLFHTYFDINQQAIGATKSWPTDQNFGLAVKSIQLPKFGFDLTELNQYNRRRIVQTKIKYEPVQITFNDDNNNLIRQLWYTYYSYYYKDPTQSDIDGVSETIYGAKGTSQKFNYNLRNTYSPDIFATAPDWGYIGESTVAQQASLGTSLGQTKIPFFRAINIYGFNQHNFVLYRLVNPIIDSFGHDTYDYYQRSGIMENQMTLRYETVKYYTGALNGADPSQVVQGFGTTDHYDTVLSPIARPGANQTIFGPGGLLDAGVGFIDDLQNGNILGAIQKAGLSYNTFKNANFGQLFAQNASTFLKGAIPGYNNQGQTNQNRGGSIFSFPSYNSSSSQASSSVGTFTAPIR